jgi:hypothetical protein
VLARHDDPDERRSAGTHEHGDPGEPADAGLRQGAGSGRRRRRDTPHGVAPRINRHQCVERRMADPGYASNLKKQ